MFLFKRLEQWHPEYETAIIQSFHWYLSPVSLLKYAISRWLYCRIPINHIKYWIYMQYSRHIINDCLCLIDFVPVCVRFWSMAMSAFSSYKLFYLTFFLSEFKNMGRLEMIYDAVILKSRGWRVKKWKLKKNVSISSMLTWIICLTIKNFYVKREEPWTIMHALMGLCLQIYKQDNTTGMRPKELNTLFMKD